MAEYIILNDNKQPIHKFKNGGKSWDEVRDCDNIAVIIPTPFIVLDFDTELEAQIMLKIIDHYGLKTKVMKTTRGVHCWFKTNDTMAKNFVKNKLAIGISCDRKVCNRNAYVKIKDNGVMREWIRYYEDEEIDYCPRWLEPINAYSNLLGMAKGDGRNQALFNYILTLQAEDFTKEDVRITLDIINRFVFAEPLSDKEMDTIYRDEAFKSIDEVKEIKKTTNKFQHDEFADALINDMNVICLNDTLYLFRDGFYQKDEKDVEITNAMIRRFSSITISQRREVKEYIKAVTNVTKEVKRRGVHPYIINIKNGRLNLLTRELIPHSENDLEFQQIPVVYEPTAQSDVLDNLLNTIFCANVEVIQLFEEIVGDCLIKENKYQKAFIFYGEGSNGKSTIFYLIRKFLGACNVSALELDKLGKKFLGAELEHKLANIGDDLNYSDISHDNGTIKKLISGDEVQVERKYGDPYSFHSYATQIFATNEIPHSRDKSNGMMRRLCFIPCLARFGNGIKRDVNIKEKLNNPQVMSALLNRALDGVDRLMENGGFTEPRCVSDAKDKYITENSTVLTWIDEECLEEDAFLERLSKDIYLDYLDWCRMNSLKQVSKVAFNKEIIRKFGFKDELHKTRKGRVFEKE